MKENGRSNVNEKKPMSLCEKIIEREERERI